MREIRLTEMQRSFVLHFTGTEGAIGHATKAALLAGYSENSAAEQGSQLLQKPHILEAIREANRQAITGRMATKSAALLERIVDDETVSDRIRLDAAKTILDRAGYIPPKATDPDDDSNKPMEEMSYDELMALVRRAETNTGGDRADPEMAGAEDVPPSAARPH